MSKDDLSPMQRALLEGVPGPQVAVHIPREQQRHQLRMQLVIDFTRDMLRALPFLDPRCEEFADRVLALSHTLADRIVDEAIPLEEGRS